MKALFIGPRFYGYENEIIRKLAEYGYDVDYFPERNDKLASIAHFMQKNNQGFSKRLNESYERKLYRIIKDRGYDLFLLIRGENLSLSFVEKIINHNINKNGRTVYYTWDSITNLPNAQTIYKLFNRRYTFDLNDALKVRDISFLPLFFLDSYNKKIRNNGTEWDIAIIASYSPERYKIVRSLLNDGYRVKHNIYLKPYLFLKQFLTNPEFRTYDKSLISMRVLGSDEIIDVYSRSKAVLDVPSSKQTGLSMRTIECLGCSMKMITTNKAIKEYDFYNTDNILLIDDYKNANIQDWLAIPYSNIDEAIRNKYSLDNWIRVILDL